MTIKMILMGAGLASALAGPAQAASDAGLQLHQTAGRTSRAIGATAGVTIRFGNDRTVRPSDKVRLSLAAGPVIALSGRNGFTRGAIALAGVELNPGYSASLNLGGRSVVRGYTLLGAADAEKRVESGEAKGKGPTTLGWIGIGAGILVGALGIAYLAVEDALDCNEGREYVCE